jgi:hypothetical protein
LHADGAPLQVSQRMRPHLLHFLTYPFVFAALHSLHVNIMVAPFQAFARFMRPADADRADKQKPEKLAAGGKKRQDAPAPADICNYLDAGPAHV